MHWIHSDCLCQRHVGVVERGWMGFPHSLVYSHQMPGLRKSWTSRTDVRRLRKSMTGICESSGLIKLLIIATICLAVLHQIIIDTMRSCKTAFVLEIHDCLLAAGERVQSFKISHSFVSYAHIILFLSSTTRKSQLSLRILCARLENVGILHCIFSDLNMCEFMCYADEKSAIAVWGRDWFSEIDLDLISVILISEAITEISEINMAAPL